MPSVMPSHTKVVHSGKQHWDFASSSIRVPHHIAPAQVRHAFPVRCECGNLRQLILRNHVASRVAHLGIGVVDLEVKVTG